MTLNTFLETIKNNKPILFKQTMAIIDDEYHYRSSEFSNGLGDDKAINPAGTNEGSCKIFSFAKIHHLNQQQTLSLFGQYYQDVLTRPKDSDHTNIRNFIKYGWDGIVFQTEGLTKK